MAELWTPLKTQLKLKLHDERTRNGNRKLANGCHGRRTLAGLLGRVLSLAHMLPGYLFVCKEKAGLGKKGQVLL